MIYNQVTCIALTLLVLFNISLIAQENDFCADATIINITGDCTSLSFTNINATSEPSVPDPSCGLFQDGDVWFTFEMPASGALRIETDNYAGSTPHSFTLYSGTCTGLQEELCFQLDHEKTLVAPQLAGAELLLRVFSYNGAAGSGFDLCVYEPVIAVNDNCQDALELTTGASCNLDLFTNDFATAEVGIAPDPDCGAYFGGDVWFKTEVPQSGLLRIETQNLISSTDKSLIIYRGQCGAFVEVFCSELDDQVTFFDEQWGGETVYIRVFSYLTEEGGDFLLCAWEPELPVNDNCANATEIVAGESCAWGAFSNALATSEALSVASPPSCGAYMGGDVWFKTTVPQSGYLTLESENLSSATPKSLSIYSGSCGSLRELFCLELEETGTLYDPDWGGQEVLIRVFTYLSEEGGNFNLCAWNQECEPEQNTVIQAGLTLTSQISGATYQWIDCADNQAIPGAISQSFTTTIPGNFAVRVNKNGCATTSSCVSVVVVDLEDPLTSNLEIFPNPTSDILKVELPKAGPTKLTVWSLQGRILFDREVLSSTKLEIDMRLWSPGVYLLQVIEKDDISTQRIIKR